MEAAISIIFRWLHVAAGITWIGLLYFFNAVNFRFAKATKPEERPAHFTKFMPIALAWFRYAALVTFIVGLILAWIEYWQAGDIISSPSAKTILVGMILGTIMFLNVWIFIWPNQKKIIEASQKGEKPDPQWASTALTFSRINTILSFPMLFDMVASKHFPMDWAQLAVWDIGLAIVAGIVLFIVQR